MSTNASSPDESSPHWRSRVRRWGPRIGLIVAGIPLLWLLLINLALWTGLVEAIVSGERPRSRVRLEHGWAWCIWPTEVHVNDLHLAIDGERWQLELDAPRGELDIDLHELLWRRFETSWIRADEAELALTLKKPHGTDPAKLEGWNRIEGFPEPILDAEPRPVPEPDEAWAVLLNDIDAGLTRLHVNAIEADFEGRLAGTLDVVITQRFGLPRVTLEMAGGEVFHHGAKAIVAEGVSARADLTLEGYDPLEIQGRPALRMLSGELAFEASLPELGWVNELGKDLPVSPYQGRGTLAGGLTLKEGTLVEGSQVIYQTEDVRLVKARKDGGPLALDGALVLEVKVNEGKGPTVLAQAELVGLRVGSVGSDQPWLTGDRLSLEAGFPRADLVEGPGSMASASAELPSFTATDLGQVGTVGKRLRLRSGQAVGHASLRTKKGDPTVFALDFGADVDDLGLDLGDTKIHTDGYVRSKGTLERGGKSLKLEPLHAKLHGLSIQTKRGRTQHNWLEVDRATVRYDQDHERLVAEVRGRLQDLRTVLAHLRPGEDIFQRVPELGMGTEPVAFSLQMTRTPGGVEIDIDQFDGPPVDLVATISRVGEATRAAVYFRRAHIGLVSTGGGSRNIEVAVDPAWFESKQGWVREALKN